MSRLGRVEPSLSRALRDVARAEREDTLSGPDGPEGRALGRAVGANVAAEREARGLPLEELAARTGIRPDLLVALERGGAVPSLRAIWHLATGLGVPFGALLRETALASSAVDFRVQPAAAGRTIASADGSFRSRPLFAEGDPRSPEVYELTLAPGCREPAAPHASGTFEHLVVVRGRLVVRCGDASAELGPGDAIFFRGDLPHAYENPGAGDAVAHLVMTYAPRA